MSNLDDTLYHGAANREAPSQTGGANWRPLPLPEGTRLGDEGVEFVEWRRKTIQEAEVRAVWIHLSQEATPEITRTEYGGPDSYKNRYEIMLLNRKVNQERITASELLRCRIAPNSEEMGLILTAIDTHKPFEAMNLLNAHCDKRDWGKLVERVTKVFKPSMETTTGGIVNETRRLLGDICDIGIKLTLIQPHVEDGEEKVNDEERDDFIFPPCLVTAIALSRSMANQPKDREHHAKASKMVKEISFRHPNSRADEIGFAEFHEVLRVINRTEVMLKADTDKVNVFEFTTFAPRLPVKARSANAKPDEKCEVHPNAKIPHTNRECRQNESNPKFKLKFQKRDRGEEADQKASKPKYDSNQKVLFIEEEEESEIDEVYLTQDRKFLCEPLNNMSSLFTPDKKLFIKIPRRAESTAKQLEGDRPLSYTALMDFNHRNSASQSHRDFDSSPEAEECSSSECEGVESDIYSAADDLSYVLQSNARRAAYHKEWFKSSSLSKPRSPELLLSSLSKQKQEGACVNMFSPCVVVKAFETDEDLESCHLPDMTELVFERQEEDANEVNQEDEDGATLFDRVVDDYPMKFDWYDEHTLLTDGGWEIVRDEEQEMSPPAASNSENVYDYI
jgi:hypothetical protein